MTVKGTDYLVFDKEAGVWREDPEQAVRDDVEKHYWLHVGRTILKDWRLYAMLAPMLLVFFLWRYLPMYELLRSFKVDGSDAKPVAEWAWKGFANFRALLMGTGTNATLSQNFWAALRNTFLLSFYGLLFGFPVPIILALFFNEVRSNGVRSILQVLTYLPKFMSTVIMTSLVVMLVRGAITTGTMTAPPGVVSQLLTHMGLITQEAANTGMLRSSLYFRAIYQVSGIWETAGYDSIVFFAAIIAISPTSYEAAQIDGANKWAQMRYVVLPSILSTIVIMLITSIGSMLSIGYEKVILLTNDLAKDQGDVLTTAQVVSTFAWQTNRATNGTAGQPGIASAAEMMNNVVGMLLVIGANTIARKASNVSLY